MASVFITDQLARRGPARPRLFEERLPLRDIAHVMIDDPRRVLPALVDSAMEQCEAVSGGISLYEANPAPGLFRWHHVRGELEKFAGATTPRYHSPCGVTLDQRKPVLVARPERAYGWISAAGVSIPECLLVPLYRGVDEPLGTLWLVSDSEGHFDANHAEIASEMGSFAAVALRIADHESELAAALTRQKTLTREMSHRLKNLLAIVQALLRMGAQRETTAQELAQTLSGQLQALSLAQDVVQPFAGTRSARTSNLRELVRTILRPYRTSTVRLVGPDVELGSEPSNVLALVFHELATNAAKYGALSSLGGTLDVVWQNEKDRLRLIWQEGGGPVVGGPPNATGFGTTLAARSIAALNGSLSQVWVRSGLVVTIELPLQSLT